MRCLELFSGTKSVGKVCDLVGIETVSVDMILPADHQCDIMDFDYKQYPKDYFDIVWASPPCTEYSILKYSHIGRKINGEIFTREKINENMKEADKLVLKTLEIINYFNTALWFMENPRTGRLKDRDIVKDLPFYDVDYCMYSHWGYKKPTRIWTNKKDFKGLTCNKKCGNMIDNHHKNNLGNELHKSKSFSQKDKYRIPQDLIFSLLFE